MKPFKAYEAIVILIVKVKKKLDCKANRKIESGQEIVSEKCSLQECGILLGGCLTVKN